MIRLLHLRKLGSIRGLPKSSITGLLTRKLSSSYQNNNESSQFSVKPSLNDEVQKLIEEEEMEDKMASHVMRSFKVRLKLNGKTTKNFSPHKSSERSNKPQLRRKSKILTNLNETEASRVLNRALELKRNKKVLTKNQENKDTKVEKGTGLIGYTMQLDSTVPPEIHSIDLNEKDFNSIGKLEAEKIPRLAHKLDRALFSPGVHFLQDPRTRIYNFTPYLKKIIKLEDFNFDLVEKFVTVSKDKVLFNKAIEQLKKFYSSTSSMTSSLTQFYLMLNNYKPDLKSRFSFPEFSRNVQEVPSSVLIRPKGKNNVTGESVYAIESDKSADQEILLSAMGHCLEALLTNEEEEFEKFNVNYKYGGGDSGSGEREKKIIETKMQQNENTYNYASYGNFLMRSQLDCYDDRLPGNGTFDLKSRAVCAIRYDQGHPELANNTYQIWKLDGRYESFQREFDDLIKTGALLKYAFQARIGQMDGIFVAYHNINSFFGFQYLPLSDIDRILYSTTHEVHPKKIKTIDDVRDSLPSYVAETQFKLSLEIWETILDRIIKDLEAQGLKDTTFRLVLKSKSVTIPKFGADDIHTSQLLVMAVPLTEEKANQLQGFLQKFETSFIKDIPHEERNENLRQHKEELDKFNKSTVKESKVGVLNYVVKNEVYFDGHDRPVPTPHPYPYSKEQKWVNKYTISKASDDPGPYLKFLQRATQLLVGRPSGNKQPDDTKEEPKNVEKPDAHDERVIEIDESDQKNPMRVYSAVGKIRMKAWENKDNNPVLYEPKN